MLVATLLQIVGSVLLCAPTDTQPYRGFMWLLLLVAYFYSGFCPSHGLTVTLILDLAAVTLALICLTLPLIWLLKLTHSSRTMKQ